MLVRRQFSVPVIVGEARKGRERAEERVEARGTLTMHARVGHNALVLSNDGKGTMRAKECSIYLRGAG